MADLMIGKTNVTKDPRKMATPNNIDIMPR